MMENKNEHTERNLPGVFIFRTTPPGPESMKAIEDFYIKENVLDCIVMNNQYDCITEKYSTKTELKNKQFDIFKSTVKNAIRLLEKADHDGMNTFFYMESDFSNKEIAYAAYLCAFRGVNFTLFKYENTDIFEIIQLP